MNDPTQPQPGELVVDASALSAFVVDLPVGGRQGLRSKQPGCELVLAEIMANQPAFGPRAGVTDHDVQELTLTEERIAMINARLPAARKLVEMLEETRAVLEDRQQRLISAVAVSAESRAAALGDEQLLGKYEATRRYRSAAALKGARTRQRNAAAEDTDARDDALDLVADIQPVDAIYDDAPHADE